MKSIILFLLCMTASAGNGTKSLTLLHSLVQCGERVQGYIGKDINSLWAVADKEPYKAVREWRKRDASIKVLSVSRTRVLYTYSARIAINPIKEMYLNLTFSMMVERDPNHLYVDNQPLRSGKYRLLRVVTYRTVLGSESTVMLFRRL